MTEQERLAQLFAKVSEQTAYELGRGFGGQPMGAATAGRRRVVVQWAGGHSTTTGERMRVPPAPAVDQLQRGTAAERLRATIERIA